MNEKMKYHALWAGVVIVLGALAVILFGNKDQAEAAVLVVLILGMFGFAGLMAP